MWKRARELLRENAKVPATLSVERWNRIGVCAGEECRSSIVCYPARLVSLSTSAQRKYQTGKLVWALLGEHLASGPCARR